MPDLDLTPEMVGPQRTRRTLAYLESVMLWPDNSEKQKELFAAGSAETTLIAARASGRLTTDELQQVRDAPPLPVFEEDERKDRYLIGTLIGFVVLQMLEFPMYGIEATISDVAGKMLSARIGKFSSKFRGKGPGESNFRHIHTNYWPKLVPVAHLWGATSSSPDWAKDKASFPCPLNELPQFLAVASSRLG